MPLATRPLLHPPLGIFDPRDPSLHNHHPSGVEEEGERCRRRGHQYSVPVPQKRSSKCAAGTVAAALEEEHGMDESIGLSG